MNIIIFDVTYFIFGISANFRTFLCKKSDYQSSNEIDNYPVVFIVSISSLHEIVNTCKN